MRTLMVLSLVASALVAAPSRGFAQTEGSADGSAADGSAADGSAAAGSADAPAPAPPAPPPANLTALRHTCETAVTNAKQAGNNLFVIDVSNVAAGTLSRDELAKTAEGQSCLTALDSVPELRQSLAVAANEAAATERLAMTKKEHEDAAKAIAKNERHVVLAYGAMWLLAAGFLLFLWRRQQGLRREILQLQKDLEAATK